MTAQLKYHQPILDLLEIEPVIPVDRIAAIEARERICGAQYPASVREWFALENAEALFHDNTNDDHLIELAELGDPAETKQGYLHVANENQGVVGWYVRLAEGDDPPVYHNNDDWNEDLSKTDWQPISETFTNFIFDMISTQCFRGWYSGAYLTANDRLPDQKTLSLLQARFQQGPTTDLIDAKVYRFFTWEGMIAIRCVTPEYLANGSAEWTIDTGTSEALLDFAQKLWDVGTLSETLKPYGHAGAEVLRRLRRSLMDP